MWNMRGGGMGGEGGVEGGLWYTELNNALGINSTYIYVELMYAYILK